jgi:hypothetical protein
MLYCVLSTRLHQIATASSYVHNKNVSGICMGSTWYKKLCAWWTWERTSHWKSLFASSSILHNIGLVTSHTVDSCELLLSVYQWKWTSHRTDFDSTTSVRTGFIAELCWHIRCLQNNCYSCMPHCLAPQILWTCFFLKCMVSTKQLSETSLETSGVHRC